MNNSLFHGQAVDLRSDGGFYLMFPVAGGSISGPQLKVGIHTATPVVSEKIQLAACSGQLVKSASSTPKKTSNSVPEPEPESEPESEPASEPESEPASEP